MTQHRTPRTWRPLLSSAALYSAAGAISALLGWALLEPFFQEGGTSGRVGLANAFIFPVIAGVVSASLVVVNKSVSRRFSGAITSAAGSFGLVFAGAFLVLVPSQVVFNWFSPPATRPRHGSNHRFRCDSGGQDTGLESYRHYCRLGDKSCDWESWQTSGWNIGWPAGWPHGWRAVRSDSGPYVCADKSPWISRMAGFIILGGMTGFLIGLMEDASCRGVLLITSGPRAGTRSVLDSKPCLVGSATACDIVLPAAPEIGPSAGAVVQRIGLSFELKALGQEAMVQVNRRPISRTCLTHGDCIRIGGTDLLFSDPGRNKT